MLKILFLSFCYTISLYSSTLLTNHCSSLLLTAIRCLSAGILLLLIRYWDKDKTKINIYKHYYQYLYAITFGFIAPFAMTAFVLNHLPMVDSTIISTSEPMLTYLLAAYFFKESLNKKQIAYLFLGTAFAFAAIVFEAKVERVSLISWQEPLILLITAILAVGWLSIGKLVKLNEPEDAIAGVGLLVTGAISLALSFISEKVFCSFNFFSIALFVTMVLFGDLVVTRMRVKLSKKHSATLLSLVCIFVPFITALHQRVFDHKHYSYKFFLIIIPSLFCFIAFYREETKLQSRELQN